MLGSSRVIVNSSGTLLDDSDFYPFGGEKAFTSSSGNTYKFTGKERDPETGNDEFGARYYSSVYGRFLSSDWSAVPAPVPYANLTNPQTLNLYAIVSDNPESFADLDGHMAFAWEGGCWTGGSCAPQNSSTASDSTPGQQPSTPPPPQDDNGKVHCTNANCTTATQTVVVHGKLSFWDKLKSHFKDTGTGPPPFLGRLNTHLFHRPWLGSVIVPLAPFPFLGGVGPAGSLAYNPDTKTLCGGLGIGASAGKNISGGPLTEGKMFNGQSYPNGADNLLSGGSISGGVNFLGPLGLQGIINANGAARGPTLGYPGAGVSATYSVCTQ